MSHEQESDALLDRLSDEEERALGQTLRAAWAPSEIAADLNQALIELALEDPLAPPTDEELVESARLRDALSGHGDHPDARLAEALRAAGAPAPPLPERAVAELGLQLSPPAPRSNVVYVAFGAATALGALAAGLALLLSPASRPAPGAHALPSPTAETAPAVSRSTAPMFARKFETRDTTRRIDRIAQARSRDLRANRYLAWGVK